MKLGMLLLIVVACLFLIGCPAYSVHPLYTDQDAVVEPALEGTWVDPDSDDKEGITFQKSGDHEYMMTDSNPATKVYRTYKVHLVRLGGQLFMDLIANDQTVDGKKLDESFGVISTHVIAEVKISGDDLAWATLEADAIQKQVNSEGARLGYQMSDGGLLVTTETDGLRRYVSAHAEDAFPDFGHLKRKGKATTQP